MNLTVDFCGIDLVVKFEDIIRSYRPGNNIRSLPFLSRTFNKVFSASFISSYCFTESQEDSLIINTHILIPTQLHTALTQSFFVLSSGVYFYHTFVYF